MESQNSGSSEWQWRYLQPELSSLEANGYCLSMLRESLLANEISLPPESSLLGVLE